MSLIAAWLLLPLVVGLLSLGLGLLAERIAGAKLSGAALIPLGFAAELVVGQAVTTFDLTAKLLPPVLVALAVAGFALSPPWRDGWRFSRWELAAAAGVYAVFAAPILLSGEATFAGYIKLDDTATWMAFTDWITSHGPAVRGLAPSSYEATLDLNLNGGYPWAGFTPLAAVHQLLGQDVAWIIQPFMASVAAMLALTISALLEPLVAGRRLRALAAFLASQPALLYGYYLWGGIKEIESTLLLALLALVATLMKPWKKVPRAALPLALASAALIGVYGLGGAVWLGPLFVIVLVIAGREDGLRKATLAIAAAAVLTMAVGLPAVARGVAAQINGELYAPTGTSIPGSPLGTLVEPLNPLQVAGIWTAPDFRIEPSRIGIDYVLIAVALAAAGYGLWRSWEKGERSLPTWIAFGFAGGVIVVAFGSPWVDGKVYATLSPAIPAAAAAAGALLIEAGRRLSGALVIAVLGGGILISNVLAYTQVNLAPRDELAELSEVANLIDGKGPTLMTDDQIYAVRHFLRDADPEGVNQLRRRQILLRDGTAANKLLIGGVDAIALPTVLEYRTVVVRRSPVASRPPANYKLVRRGEYYDVWQRPEHPTGDFGRVLDHLSLGGEVDPGGVPSCGQVLALAETATAQGPGGRLVATPAPPVGVISLAQADAPAEWRSGDYLIPGNDAGELRSNFGANGRGDYEIWLGGSVRARVETRVDGKLVGDVRHHLVSGIGYTRIGEAELEAGRHGLVVSFSGADLHPGSSRSDALDYPVGPVIVALAPGPTADELASATPAEAASLCGKRWDWIEVVAPAR
ncbi:MAG: hypothetical protein QOI84_1231 [Solirubrobacterales bacterium]|nr:hypothetical protein [Solirubrobacterales bacterium]